MTPAGCQPTGAVAGLSFRRGRLPGRHGLSAGQRAGAAQINCPIHEATGRRGRLPKALHSRWLWPGEKSRDAGDHSACGRNGCAGLALAAGRKPPMDLWAQTVRSNPGTGSTRFGRFQRLGRRDRPFRWQSAAEQKGSGPNTTPTNRSRRPRGTILHRSEVSLSAGQRPLTHASTGPRVL